MASASGYNHHRFARAVLKKSRKWEPSLTVQLFHNHWRFENSPMTFQYAGPMTPFLLALRSQVIPASLIPFLYDIQPPVSFVDGCLVVEVQDFRKTPEVKSRVVMRPAAEALAQTIDVMLERKGERWDQVLALELESRIIAATSPPLYLGTSILASRNATLAMSLTSPAPPNLSADGTFRHAGQSTTDEKSEVERMRKMLRAGERNNAFQPNWSVLRLREHLENKRLAERSRGSLSGNANGTGNGDDAMQGLGGGANGVNGSGSQNGHGNGHGGPSHAGGGASGGAAGGDKPKKSKKKRPAEEPEEGKKAVKKKKTTTTTDGAGAGAANTNANANANANANTNAASGAAGEKKKKTSKKKKKEDE